MEKYTIINFDNNSTTEIINAIRDILNHFGIYTVMHGTNHGTQIDGIIPNAPDAHIDMIERKIKQIKNAVESVEVQDNNYIEFQYFDIRRDQNAYITIIIKH